MEKSATEALARVIAGGRVGTTRADVLERLIHVQGADEASRTRNEFDRFLRDRSDLSFGEDDLLDPDDCPDLPPLESIGERFHPPFLSGRFLFRKVWGGFEGQQSSTALVSSTSARVDALSTGPRECAAAGIGIPFLPRLGTLPTQRLVIRAHLHGFFRWKNLLAGEGSRCGYTNRGRLKLFVMQSAGGGTSTVSEERILFDAPCVGDDAGLLPGMIEIELGSGLQPRLHIAWLVIEACVDPPGDSNLACVAELMNPNRPPGVQPSECEGFATATAEVDVAVCAVDLFYRNKTVSEIEEERRARELRDRVRDVLVDF